MEIVLAAFVTASSVIVVAVINSLRRQNGSEHGVTASLLRQVISDTTTIKSTLKSVDESVADHHANFVIHRSEAL